MKKKDTRLSKLLVYILGHKPDEFGLVPDVHGYVKLKELLKAVNEDDQFRFIRLQHIKQLLITEADPPIEIKNNLIRAKCRDHLFKHIIAKHPPKLLHTCVRKKAHQFVLEKGIFPSSCKSVILSAYTKMAERIGKRTDHKPVILTVNVEQSIAKGVIFHQAGSSLYLADLIPVGCFTGPKLPKAKPEPKKEDKTEQTQKKLSGSFILDMNEKKQKKAGNKNKVSWKKDAKKIRKLKQNKWSF